MLRSYAKQRLISKSNIRSSSCLYSLYLKRGRASGGREEGRDPSTVEKLARQGVASQTSEKAYDGAAEAVNVSSDSDEADKEKVKTEFEKREEGRDYRKRGDDDGLPINTAKGV